MAETNCTRKDQREKKGSIRGGEGRRGEERGEEGRSREEKRRGEEKGGKRKEENKGPHPGVFRKLDIPVAHVPQSYKVTTLKNERILHYKGQLFPFPAVFSTSTSTDHDVFFDSKRYNHCIKQMPKYLLKGYNNYRDI